MAVNPPTGGAGLVPGAWVNGPANWGQGGPPPFLNEFYTFAEFNGSVFAGGRAINAPLARILKSSDGGATWTDIPLTFKKSDNGVQRLWAASDGCLYAATQAGTPKVYRTSDGTHWVLVRSLDPTDAYGRWFVEFNGFLYLGMIADPGIGARIYRSADGKTWQLAVQFPLPITRVESLFVGNGNIYATTDQGGPGGAGFIFGSADGVNFTRLNTNQMIGAMGSRVHSLVFFNGAYYVGQQDVNAGGRIWASNDLATWSAVFTAPGGIQEPEVYRLYPAAGLLWAGTRTLAGTGGRVYSSPDGITWTQSGSDGFGDINYHGPFDFIFVPGFNRLLTSQQALSINTTYPTRPQFIDFGP